MEHGAQFVAASGMMLMPEWYADNLAMTLKASYKFF